MGALSNCGWDENKSIRGGLAGDQTGGEYAMIPWWDDNWVYVLRHPDTQVRTLISQLAEEAARNDKIGYDQSQRLTFWNELQKVGYHPKDITVACEADCSASTTAIIKAAGHLLNIPQLKNIQLTSTHYLKGNLTSAGFNSYSSSDYTRGSSKLVAGDILLAPGSHVAIWCDSNPGTTEGYAGSGGAELGGIPTGGGTPRSVLSESTYKDYSVKAGDSLEKIAKKYHTTVSMLIYVNKLDNTTLSVGQSIKVPLNASGGLDNSEQDRTKSHTMSVTVSHPTIEVQFYTENGMLAVLSEARGGISEPKLDNDILSINTVRNMGSDCPTFTMNLVWRNDWYHQISSNDLVLIKMQRPPEVKRTVFLGLIDDIRRAYDFSTGSPQRTLQVTGRGLNKVFLNYEMGLLESMSSAFGLQNTGMYSLMGCSPADAINKVLGWYVGNGINYRFSNGSTFESNYQANISSDPNNIVQLLNTESYLTYCGNMWNFMKELSNTPFNELFWEVNGDKAEFICRPTPFNKEEWNSLERYIITDDTIVSDSIGRSDLETYSLYKTSSSSTDSITDNFFPFFYKPMLEKYGISMLEVNTPYFIAGDESERGFNTNLFNWNIKNNKFSNGTVTVKGEAKYKVGQRCILESENLEFYIESVSHNFTMYGSWTTTLGLTRGIAPGERFTAPWGAFEEFTLNVQQAIINQAGGANIDWSNLPQAQFTPQGNAESAPTSDPTSYTSNGTVNTSSNAKAVFTFLTTTGGFNKAAACGIMANIDSESGFNPAVIGDSGTSYGLCQWHNNRKTAVQNYCKTNKGDISSLEGQMEFLMKELKSGFSKVYEFVKNVPDTADGAYQAAEHWCIHFEVPADKYNKGIGRGRNAKKYYESF